MKAITSVCIDPELLKKAKQENINISGEITYLLKQKLNDQKCSLTDKENCFFKTFHVVLNWDGAVSNFSSYDQKIERWLKEYNKTHDTDLSSEAFEERYYLWKKIRWNNLKEEK